MSWGGSEFSGETSYDSYYFSEPGRHLRGLLGRQRRPGRWPAVSPNVLAVGGTTLTLTSAAVWQRTGWSSSGGGTSTYESLPSYQKSRDIPPPRGSRPTCPTTPTRTPGSPSTTRMARVGGGRRHRRRGAAVGGHHRHRRPGPVATLSPPAAPSRSSRSCTRMGAGHFHDITSGNSTAMPPGPAMTTSPGWAARSSMRWSPRSTAGPSPAPDKLVITAAPSSVTAGSPFNVTVTAETSSGQVDPSFAGTVKLHQHRRPEPSCRPATRSRPAPAATTAPHLQRHARDGR